MVERAAERNPAASYDAYGGDRLPYDDASFDVVFSICVLHHVPLSSRAGFTAELRRVTRPGGLVMIGEHNPYNPMTRLIVYRCAFDEDAVLLRATEVESLLRGAGLETLERRYILVLPSDARPLRRLERALSSTPAGAQYIAVARRPAGE
jgi:SAM-dependent methyltransferase